MARPINYSNFEIKNYLCNYIYGRVQPDSPFLDSDCRINLHHQKLQVGTIIGTNIFYLFTLWPTDLFLRAAVTAVPPSFIEPNFNLRYFMVSI